MAKIFETSEDIVEMINDKFEETGLAAIGINLKVLSVSKQKEVLKIQKTSPTTAFLTKKDLQIMVYEPAFDRLSTEIQERLIETLLSNVWFDSEKDKLNIETNPFVQIFNMRKKYPNIVDYLEASFLVIKQLEDEEKERKQAEKEAKKASKSR